METTTQKPHTVADRETDNSLGLTFDFERVKLKGFKAFYETGLGAAYLGDAKPLLAA